MAKKEPSPLFTKQYRDNIKEARELNNVVRSSHHWYFHPTEKKMVVKSIDLTKNHPLCDISSKPKPDPKCEEKWVEAYIINDAKEHGWEFKPSNRSDNSLRFLSSQLNFRKHYGNIDLLFAYSNQHLVLWELKSDAGKNSFNDAMKELKKYCSKLRELFITDQNEFPNARKAYDLGEVIKIDGYVVLPQNKFDYQTYPFGLYEYSCPGLVINHGELVEPWKNYSKSMEINFELKCEPK